MFSGALAFSAVLKSAAVLTASFFVVQTTLKWTCPCNEHVKVKVCTEALCPGCQEFVLNDLVGTYQKLGPDVMDLELVPFGNAKLSNKTVACQHGVGECDANSYEQCMIHTYPVPKQYLPMLECLENELPMGSHEEKFDVEIFEKCARQAGLDFPSIQFCHDDPTTAWQVLHKAAKDTPSDHKYVPWVVIDGKHLDVEHEDLLEEVCKAYVAKGGSYPACKSATLESF